MGKLLLFVFLLQFLGQVVHAQTDSTINRISQFPNRFFSKLNSKAEKLDDQLTKQSVKYLQKMAKKEKKMQEKMAKTDSAGAARLFAGSQEKYLHMEQMISSQGDGLSKPLQGEYLANIDSTKSALSFLQQNKNLLPASPGAQAGLNSATQQFNDLQSKFQEADQVKAFIKQRKQFFQDNLARLKQSLGVDKFMAEYNQQVYYYSEQVREYKEMFNDPDKMLQKALVILNKIPAFQTFLKNNSQLAGLFGVSDNYGSAGGLLGLQTRDQVQQLLQGQIGGAGSSGMASFNSTLSTAHAQLDQYKDKLNQLGGGSGDIDMPQFKPNPEKTHPFLKRLELGTNLQTTRASNLFPTTTDIGISIGYKINSKSTIGIGGSYKIGWGSGLNHIAITSQGASIRSFLDYKLKGTFYLSGGFEYNYQLPFSSFQQIQSLNDWTKSGLIGFSKMVSLPGKVIKKTKVQILWDFLSYSQVPRTQPIVFRVGYNF